MKVSVVPRAADGAKKSHCSQWQSQSKWQLGEGNAPSKKVGAHWAGMTQVSIGRWTDTPKVVYPYDGLLFSLKREDNSEIGCNTNRPWNIILHEISQTQKDGYSMIPPIWGTWGRAKWQAQKEECWSPGTRGRREGRAIVEWVQSFCFKQ